MSALQPNSFLTHFSLKPCTKVTASSLQPVLMFVLYPIVAVCVCLLFFIPLAAVHLCCCFKVAGFICLCLVFHFFLSSSHSSVDISREKAQPDVHLVHLHYFRSFCSPLQCHICVSHNLQEQIYHYPYQKW